MSTKALSLPTSQPPPPPQNLENPNPTPPPATFTTSASAPTYLDANGNPTSSPKSGFGKNLQSAGSFIAEGESQTQGENEYWDNLWKTDPSAVWKAAPAKALSYSLHEKTTGAVNTALEGLNTALGVNRIAKQHGNEAAIAAKTKQYAEDISSLFVPKPEESFIKIGVPPIPGEFELGPSQVLEDTEEPLPANLKNVTPAAPKEPARLPVPQKIEDIPGAVKITSNAKITTGTMAGKEVPPERTTGVPESDTAIKQGGGIPGGKFEKAGKMEHDLHLFHDPESGTTLALPANKVTSENVAKSLADKRAEYAKADTARKIANIPGSVDITSSAKIAAEHPTITALKEKFGATTNPEAMVRGGASFLHSDGTVTHTGAIEHPSAISSAQGMGPFGAKEVDRPQFINDTGSIRVRFRPAAKAGPELVFSVPQKGVTPEQVSMMKQGVGKMGRNGNLLIEVAHPENEVSEGARSWPDNDVKEFARPSDVEPILQKLGVHPESTPIWATEAAKNAQGGFTVDPRTGEIPKSGKILSVLPEKEVDLGHPATAEDITKYYNENKTLFEAHPELHIGGYGNELNISAIGPNAEEVAKKLDQHSVYDLGEGKEIVVGGKNKNKQFPDYSLDQRLADLKGELPIKSNATLLPVPEALKGTHPNMTDESVIAHEYGHGAQAIVNGGILNDLRSHWHPDAMKTGSAAQAATSWRLGGLSPSQWFGHVDNMLNVLEGQMAGGVTQEVIHNFPWEENIGVGGDVRDALNILKHSGIIDEGQQADILNYLKKSWKNQLLEKDLLTGNTLADIIKKYSGDREEGLRPELLASPKKIEDFTKEVKEYVEHTKSNRANEPNSGKSGGSKPSGAGIETRGNFRGRAGIDVPGASKNVTGTEGQAAPRTDESGLRKSKITKPPLGIF